MPPPNQPNKSLSLRYVYVPMQHIRPLAFWKEVLNGVQNPHESLVNAQTVMATAALVGRRRFKGNWPNASIFCSGIYIGSEFIQEEDLIRLAASTGCVTDIMEVRQIKLSFNNLQASSSSPEAENSGIFFAGKAFTVDPAKAFSDSGGPCRADVYPDYGSLYWLHDPNRLYKVSLAKVLGRCFEPDAMRLWFPTLPANNPSAVLTQGMRGIIDARNFSTKTDKRLQPGQAWFWADTRMQALDLHSLNGVEASSHDRLREDKLEAGQKALRVLARPTAKNQADMRQAAERPKAHAGDALGMGKQISQQASNNRQAGATDDENGDRDGSCGDDEIHRSVEEEKDSDDEVEITKTVTAPVKRKKRSAEAMSATQTPGVGSGRSNSNGSNKREDEDEDPVKMLQRFKAQRIST